MENYIYELSFASDCQDNDDLSPAEMEEMAILLQRYDKGLKENPKFVLPFAHAVFEKTVAACERIAKEFSGRIKASIDYSFYSATVELWCCYVEFECGEFMSVLRELTDCALAIQCQQLKVRY